MVVGYQIAIVNVLADLNLVVQYRIAIHIYVSKKILVVAQADHQTTKFNSLPYFPAIRYVNSKWPQGNLILRSIEGAPEIGLQWGNSQRKMLSCTRTFLVSLQVS